MMTEISARTTYPYSAITLIIATFPDGTVTVATGAAVGRNDILTATHAIYSPEHGGAASSLDIYPGGDFNAVSRVIEDVPYRLDGYSWQSFDWSRQAFANSDNETFTLAETQYDVAVIGLSVPIGDLIGWFELAPGCDQPQWAQVLGYSQGRTGMMPGKVWVELDPVYAVYSATSRVDNDLLGAGSSGGPLFILDKDGNPAVIGVKSSGSSISNHWADIGLLYDQLAAYVMSDDILISASGATLTGPKIDGTPGNDRFTPDPGSHVIDGGAGMDTVRYSGVRSNYAVTPDGDGFKLKANGGAGGTDHITNIERLVFRDAAVAFDIDGSAGQAYRLYQAAFDREPDLGGLGVWMNQLDCGQSLEWVSAQFQKSEEFHLRYGTTVLTDQFVTLLYQNVLHRTPDEGGRAAWSLALDAGAQSRAQVLAGFSESDENQAALIGVQNGIGYAPIEYAV